ncbi:unnamed protein product [Rotaria sp. Silwood2]|nr:unnamed protein product [Rotaria sp. Silwood2]CAF2831009.1 unnamed protein product [Rotaria sp. Silwood2]CAF3273725.1 unnamed protein product [Rotaria sp. Silwood2]CAF4075528.1 unnamed protein product [Rotaria sp. Silwood2]CAF4132964.1 unnamed protein product [Rotaria sp. Silwood2]
MTSNKNPVILNVESRFGSTTNSSLDSPPISELIDFHKKRLRKQLKYLYIVSGIIAMVGLVFLITSFFLPKCDSSYRDCSSLNIVFLTVGSSIIGLGVVFALSGMCFQCCCMKQQFDDVNATEQQHIVWRLDGAEWTRYLDYIHGPNRAWIEMAQLSSFCCRRSAYERLMNRQYGYIVLHETGLIIDELYFISFRQYTLQGVQLLDIDEYQRTVGLRIHTYLNAGRNSRNCYFDLFAPSSVSLEQLKTIAKFYNIKIPGLNVLGLAMDGIPLAQSTPQAFS